MQRKYDPRQLIENQSPARKGRALVQVLPYPPLSLSPHVPARFDPRGGHPRPKYLPLAQRPYSLLGLREVQK